MRVDPLFVVLLVLVLWVAVAWMEMDMREARSANRSDSLRRR
jgi:hypothetical protein